MPFKLLFRTAAAVLFLAACAVIASAQVATISGRVTLKQADGTPVPVKDAQIDIYRTDITQEYHVKTGKNGNYTHAGIPFSGVYTIIVSAPNARPTYATNLRMGNQTQYDFELEPGDGSRLTLDSLKNLKGGGGGGTTPAAGRPGGSSGAPAEASKEEKARAEALRKEREKIEEGNKKITESNTIVKRAFETGNTALEAKNYDAAIASYEEGLAAREEAALYANRSEAYRRRGVDRYNSALKLTEQSAKDAALESAYKDWRAAAESANKAVELMKTATEPSTDPNAKATQEQNRLAAYSTRAEAMRLVATKVDKTQADAAYNAFQEYVAMQIDPAKKSKLRADAVKILFDANAYDRAAEEYRKVLADDPDNLAANLYLGFSLFNSGDKSKFQEAANYIGRYAEKAPESDPTKLEAKSILDFLKTQENIKPEKIQTGPARRRRG